MKLLQFVLPVLWEEVNRRDSVARATSQLNSNQNHLIWTRHDRSWLRTHLSLFVSDSTQDKITKLTIFTPPPGNVTLNEVKSLKKKKKCRWKIHLSFKSYDYIRFAVKRDELSHLLFWDWTDKLKEVCRDTVSESVGHDICACVRALVLITLRHQINVLGCAATTICTYFGKHLPTPTR